MPEPNMEGYQSPPCWDGFRSKDAFARAGLGRCLVLDKSGPAAGQWRYRSFKRKASHVDDR